MVSKTLSIFTIAILIMLFSTSASATVVDILCMNWEFDPLSADRWSFDYDLQLLTLNEVVYIAGPEPSEEYHKHDVWVNAEVDSESTFHVVLNVTNETIVPWTGYIQEFHLPHMTLDGFIIEGSVICEKFPEIQVRPYSGITLSGPDPVFPGQLFTIEFDLWSSYDPGYHWFDFVLNRTAIPEPTTVCLLALGALGLLRRRKGQK